ncbi:ABC transporter permease [Svornostia abyssi]|uniref:ABC transporter permease n=1 Tax=Svornostia abyssi TaxID=2898438 RepID=A0ABY5PAC5_9ACTN|nr:ABC transporter permease [Parviterribacteraceae bacterium J379]
MTAVPANAAAPVRPRRRPRVGARRLALRAVVPLTLIGLWCLLSYGGIVDPLYLPSPTEMWNAFNELRADLPSAIATTVGMTLTGFVIGTALGVSLGLLMAYSSIARDLLSDVLDLTRPVPVFALIPLFLLWFGIGRGPQIALIALGTSVILGVTTLEAIRNVNPIHVRAALTLGASRGTIYRRVVLPSIFPHLLGAIRVAAAASWGLDVAAELIGSQNGLGYLMIVRQQYLDTAGILVVVVVYAVLALALDRAIVWLERPLTRWTHRDQRAGVAASILGRA